MTATLAPVDEETRQRALPRYAEAMHRTSCSISTDWRTCPDHAGTPFDRFAAAAIEVAIAERADEDARQVAAKAEVDRVMREFRP